MEYISHALTFFVGGAIGVAISYWKAVAKEEAKIAAINRNLQEIKINNKEISKAIESGKIEAVNKKMDMVLANTKKVTEATEFVKNNVELEHWRVKEQEQIKRSKLEELIFRTEELPTYIIEYTALKIDKRQDVGKLDNSKLNKALIIQKLYLPELSEEFENVQRKFQQLTYCITEASFSSFVEKNNTFSDEQAKEYSILSVDFRDSLNALLEAAQSLTIGSKY